MAPLLQVYDMPAAVRFYRDVLGFELVTSSDPLSAVREDFHWGLLRTHGIEIMLNTAYDEGERPPRRDPAREGPHDDVCLYFGCGDLDAVYEHLRAGGVVLEPPRTAPYGMRQLHCKDPDGYNLCFQHPASQETRDNWKAWYGE
jgi:uncharacterized glyoxalase superfamily protein PhnB